MKKIQNKNQPPKNLTNHKQINKEFKMPGKTL